MARRRIGFRRRLGAWALFSVAYGEVGSSLFFALGIVASYALGLTPWVLLAVGLLFVVVALSYAEGAAALPEAGGGAMLVRRAFGDLAGFSVGWLLLLDYLIVVALAGLFASRYTGHAAGVETLTRSPWDVATGIVLMGTVTAAWLAGQRRLIRGLARFAAVLALAVHLVLAVLGLVFLASADALGRGVEIGTAPGWRQIAFALPLAMLAYTGLETVANLAAETRGPERALPRGLLAGIGAAVAASFAVGLVGISAYPVHAGPSGRLTTDLGTDWRGAPLVGISAALRGHLPSGLADGLRVAVAAAGAAVLVAALATAVAGAGRLAYSLARYAMLPHPFSVLSRRTLVPWPAIVAATGVAALLLVVADWAGRASIVLAGVYSFGILIAFTAVQLAVAQLRVREPALHRPFRVPLSVRLHGVPVPLPALAGAAVTLSLWGAAVATHAGARIGGPLWLLAGIVLFSSVRMRERKPILGPVAAPAPSLVPEEPGAYRRILVPLKLGAIGEEALAAALRLAGEHGASIRALHVLPVPRDLPLDAPLPEVEQRARAALEEARRLAGEQGVEIETRLARGRSIGDVILAEAEGFGADLVLLGSAPRWRRQSRLFSPTVEDVLRRAPCEVMVIAYPEGVLEEA